MTYYRILVYNDVKELDYFKLFEGPLTQMY